MGATILVADDDAAIVALLADLLDDEGHAVLRAHNGRQALAHLEAGGVDLLITDNMMPGLSGLDLIRRMQADPALAVPTILLSAAAVASPSPSPTVVLPKPFDLDELLALVADLLALPRAARQNAARPADDSFVAAVLPRFLARNPGTETILARLGPTQLAARLREWLDTDQARRAILAAEIERAVAGMAPAAGSGPTLVRFISCRNDAGARLATRLTRRLGGPRCAVVDDDTATPDVAVILCPPT
jgi:CheY-like chemotaxis protein